MESCNSRASKDRSPDMAASRSKACNCKFSMAVAKWLASASYNERSASVGETLALKNKLTSPNMRAGKRTGILTTVSKPDFAQYPNDFLLNWASSCWTTLMGMTRKPSLIAADPQ